MFSAKIPRHTRQNAITEGDLECILTRNCEGTEQLLLFYKKEGGLFMFNLMVNADGGLTTAGSTNDGNKLSLLNGEGYAIQCFCDVRLSAVIFF